MLEQLIELIERIELLKEWYRKGSLRTGIFVQESELDLLIREMYSLSYRIKSKLLKQTDINFPNENP